MAKLPRVTATTPPPRETGLVRAQDIGALTRTGDAEVFQEIARFGGVLGDVAGLGAQAYMNRQQIDDEIEAGVASQKAKEIFRQKEDEVSQLDVSIDMPLPGDPKYLETLTTFSTTERDRFLQEAVKSIEKDATKLSSGFKSPRAKARFETWYNNNYADFVDSLRSKYDLKLHDYQIDQMSKLAESAARNGDMDTANKFIDMMDKHELITPTQATRRKKALAEFSKQSMGDDLYETAKDVPYPVNVEFVNAMPGVDKTIRNDVIARLKRDNEILTATTNPKVYWDTLRKITKDPRSVTDEMLGDLVGPNSLTLEDSRQLRNQRDRDDDPLKTPRAQLYFNRLDALYPDRDIDEGEAYSWDIANEKMTQFFESTKNPTAAQARDVFNEITADKRRGFLDRLWRAGHESFLGAPHRAIFHREAPVIMVSPERRRFNVPANKKQLFIDNGYVEE